MDGQTDRQTDKKVIRKAHLRTKERQVQTQYRKYNTWFPYPQLEDFTIPLLEL